MCLGMKCEVQVVADHELPTGVDRVLVERTRDVPLLLITDSAAGSWRLLYTWARDRHECTHVFELKAAG